MAVFPTDKLTTVTDSRFVPEKGVWVYDVSSQYLSGSNPVEVLLLPNYDSARAYRVLYVLPVHPGIGGRWGDGLQEIRKLGAHESHDLICVSPAFDGWPYYGSYASDPQTRHEEYILEVLVPLIERLYTTPATPEGRGACQ